MNSFGKSNSSSLKYSVSNVLLMEKRLICNINKSVCTLHMETWKKSLLTDHKPRLNAGCWVTFLIPPNKRNRTKRIISEIYSQRALERSYCCKVNLYEVLHHNTILKKYKRNLNCHLFQNCNVHA